jgi:hypothetical protein
MAPRPRPIPFLAATLVSFGVMLGGCGGAGRWGHARHYVPTSEEKQAIEGARDLDVPMAQLKPEAWRGQKVRFFMVVGDRRPGPGGAAYLTGKQHVLNEINGCENKFDEDSCRVTIKPTGHETVHAVVRLAGDDDVGAVRVGPGSLLRVVGVLGDATDPDDGRLVIQASWYRQWPLGYYAREGELLQ